MIKNNAQSSQTALICQKFQYWKRVLSILRQFYWRPSGPGRLISLFDTLPKAKTSCCVCLNCLQFLLSWTLVPENEMSRIILKRYTPTRNLTILTVLNSLPAYNESTRALRATWLEASRRKTSIWTRSKVRTPENFIQTPWRSWNCHV